jgi:hypothetical protein
MPWVDDLRWIRAETGNSRSENMPEISFSVYCERCGEGLCYGTTVDGTNVSVEPCENCIAEATSNGFDKGYEEAENRYDKEEEE